ncbi:hypothetical protein [Paraflavitalea speifideaquila]|uniref:hypothetical protein n=1 Tax=Paraflavitalea speifideaquila TaxID=3076558 RepID=UPI0028EE6447|nr:hypothetical protein [Paraflavitalea speifideiaquila]
MIILWLLLATTQPILAKAQYPITTIQFDFCGSPIQFEFDKDNLQPTPSPLSQQSIQSFYSSINTEYYQPMVNALLMYKEKYKPDDWLFYQLIRKTAQYISPKADDYIRYTLYKWFLLTQTGYDAMLTISGNRMLFYIRCNEDVYNIPTRTSNGKQYVCLNYHDYGEIDFKKRYSLP